MTDDCATLVLVNPNPDQPQTILVQAGAYAEHQCVSVQPAGGEAVVVGKSYFTVELAPGAGERFFVKMKRYAQQPTLRRPWSRK